ncbi:MAG: hypothetical protein FWD46_01895 [Cystobacterineae bacterium]|nr:hypothetical protein [Cystobacterineae bacterium]
MKMTKEQVLERLKDLATKGKEVLKTEYEIPVSRSTVWGESGTSRFARKSVNFDSYFPWHTQTLSFLNHVLLPDNQYVSGFRSQCGNNPTCVNSCVKLLENLIEDLEKDYISIGSKKSDIDCLSILNNIFSRFHKVVKQLRTRHKNRNTLDVEDEYDMQDLLHAILQLYFDDIRPEKWTPDYAGGSSRMDFLLKNEQVVIEVKRIRERLGDRKLGEELIVDIEKYKRHPDCNRLLCFIYDPEGKLENPAGIMNDLNAKHDGFAEVIVKP